MLQHDSDRDRWRWLLLATLAIIGFFWVVYLGPEGPVKFESSNLDAEVAFFSSKLQLQPGMTICEMGAADGTLLVRLGGKVMPGGKLVGTSPLDVELKAMRAAVEEAGMGQALSTYQASDENWAPGMPDDTCDVIYSRMVYHMIPKAVATSYPAQWKSSLKHGGRLYITDHNPMDGTTTGPRKPIFLSFMPVVPEETEVGEIEAGGFTALGGPRPHPFYSGGYGCVYVPTTEASAAA